MDEETLAYALAHHQNGRRYTLVRREHAPPDWPSWAAWFGGHHTQAQTLLAQEHPPHHAAASAPHNSGQAIVWVAAQPLSAFGAYTLARYTYLRAAGAHVGVLPAWKVAFLENHAELPELEILPEAVYLRHHTRVGSRNGATRITDPELVTATRTLVRRLHSQHTIGLDEFTRNHTR